MAYWIFQGNPKQFDIDSYLKENDVLDWRINQKHYKDDIHIGDKVFIWRSDGGIKNSGGVVGYCEVIAEPNMDKLKVDMINYERYLIYNDWYERNKSKFMR